ncbi:Chromatin structure remodeling complex protein sfh1 [Rhizina undulata]
MKPPQALVTTYASRISTFCTPLIVPAGLPSTGQQGAFGSGIGSLGERSSGRTKRGTTIINYAEVDGDDDLELEVDSGPRGGAAAPTPQAMAGAGVPAMTLAEKRAMIQEKPTPNRPAPVTALRTDTQMRLAAELPTILIPIRLSFELDPSSRGRIHDTFMWNLNETIITPDVFAYNMCLDLELPVDSYCHIISSSIRDQIAEYAPVATISLPEGTGEMRVVCNLNFNMGDTVFTDKFEWDLAGGWLTPEMFAKLTAADCGYGGEWVNEMTAGIYEFCLQKKKDLCETGIAKELENEAFRTETEAGWRYDPEGLGQEWEPKVEVLSREEIERREGDREREVRRLRRETARFGAAQGAWGAEVVVEEQLGRGSRVKRKRQRSLSPVRGTPSRGTPAGTGVGNGWSEWEKGNWRCACCLVGWSGTWCVREGPEGPRSLCHTCGTTWAETGKLPEWARGLHKRNGEKI